MPTTRHVALTLATYADVHGRNARPGAERLAGATGLHVRAIRKHLAILLEAKWITQNGQPDTADDRPRGRPAAVYNLHIPEGNNVHRGAPYTPVDNPGENSPHP